MSIENFNPPRYPAVPMTPLPQTVLGTIEHSGLPTSTPENVTDIPPDLGWMSQMQLFCATFEMKKDQKPGTQLTDNRVIVMPHMMLLNAEVEQATLWTMMPYFGSMWWSGVISYKFIAIKPPRVTGKILISYSFDSEFDFASNTKKLAISKEWDLGQSNTCEFDVSSLNQLRLRPVRLPRTDGYTYTPTPESFKFQTQNLPSHSWMLGKLHVEVASQLQPGNLFPDRIRILAFKSFKNFQGFLPTDFRGSQVAGAEIASTGSLE